MQQKLNNLLAVQKKTQLDQIQEISQRCKITTDKKL